jgi:hypothetical protein
VQRLVELGADFVAFGTDSAASFDLDNAFRSIQKSELRVLTGEHFLAMEESDSSS